MLKERKKDQKRKKKGLDNVRIVRDFRLLVIGSFNPISAVHSKIGTALVTPGL
jgi:hypothetical protein